MIEFRCPKCDRKISASDDHAGKAGRCPQCRGIVMVPAGRGDSEDAGTQSGDPAYDVDLLEVDLKRSAPDEAADRRAEEAVELLSAETPEPAAPPGVGWPISAVVYPLNGSGIVHLVALWLLLFVFSPLVMMKLGLGMEYVPLVYALPLAYVVYYYAECIRDRSGGGRRAPAFWMHPTDSSKWDVLSQLFLVVGCVAVYFVPVSVYYIVRERADAIYWLLLIVGGFLFPMSLLAAVWFDSLAGLNPILVLQSIGRTFLPYCATVLVLFGAAWSFVALGFRVYSFWLAPARVLPIRVVQLYLVFVAAALLGGFYHRYKARLDWED